MAADELKATSRARGPAPAWAVVLFLVVAGVLVNFWRLGEGPIAGTEPHRVIPGHVMAQGGSWIAQRLLDRWYMTKPPGMAWVMAAAERLTGESNAWVWRTPGALCGVALPLLLWFTLRRWAGDMAGLGAGLATMALFALWSQNKSAETDGVLTLFSTGAALAAMHIGFNPQRRWHWAAGLTGCICFTAMMMLKGPVAAPAWIGAVIGTAWATGRWQWIGRPAVWLGPVAGTAALVIYGVVLTAELVRLGVTPDYHGLQNFRERLLLMNPGIIFYSLSMPVILLAYSMPVSAMLLFIPSRAVRFGEELPLRIIARAAAIGFGVAVAIYAMSRIEQPRYGYPALPLLAVVAGCVAEAWRRGDYSEAQVTRMRQLMTATTAILAVLSIGLAANAWTEGSTDDAELGAIVAAAALIGVWGVRAWVRREVRNGLIAGALLLVVAGAGFAQFKVQDLEERSTYVSGVEMRKIVGPGDVTVAAAAIAVDQPEMLWYAGVGHKWFAGRLDEAFGVGGYRGWVVMNEREWKRWSADSPGQFTRIHRLPQPRGTVLAWREPTAKQ